MDKEQRDKITREMRDNINNSQLDFEDYVKSVRHFQSWPSAADLILRGEYVVWKAEQMGEEHHPIEIDDTISEAADD